MIDKNVRSEIPASMDEALTQARDAFNDLPAKVKKQIAAWATNWYLTMGYKSLGRILVAYDRGSRKR